MSTKTLGILVSTKPGTTQRHDLTARRVALGRARGNDIRLESGSVSERHAQLEHRAGFWVLTDLSSRNGTYLNGRKIDGPVPLRHDDMIYIGDFVLRIEPPPPSRHATIPMPGRPMVDPSVAVVDLRQPPPVVLAASAGITLGAAFAPHAQLVRGFLEDVVTELLGADRSDEPKWKRLKPPLTRCLTEIGVRRGYDEAALQRWYVSDEYSAMRVELTELVKRRVGIESHPPMTPDSGKRPAG